jgi:hypothetical protein
MSELEKRIAEIKYQWAAYKANPETYNKNDLIVLKEQAKKYKVVLK